MSGLSMDNFMGLESRFAARVTELLSVHSQSDLDSCRELLHALNDMVAGVRACPPDLQDLRLLLEDVHDFLVVSDYAVRAMLFRLFRHCLTGPASCQALLDLEYHWPIIISLERDHDYVMERKEALKLIHHMVLLSDPQDFPLAFARALSTIGGQSKEDLRLEALEALRCLALRNCALCALADGFHTLFDAVLEPSTADIAEPILITIIRLLNEPEHRLSIQPTMHLQRLLSAFTDLDSPPAESLSRLAPAAKALVTLLRSWAGVTLLTADDACLPTLIRLLMDDTVAAHVQEVILDVVAELFEPLVSRVPSIISGGDKGAKTTGQRCYLPGCTMESLAGPGSSANALALGPQGRASTPRDYTGVGTGSGSLNDSSGDGGGSGGGGGNGSGSAAGHGQSEQDSPGTPKRNGFLKSLLRKNVESTEQSPGTRGSPSPDQHSKYTRHRSHSAPDQKRWSSTSSFSSSPWIPPPLPWSQQQSQQQQQQQQQQRTSSGRDGMSASTAPPEESSAAVDPTYNMLDPYSAFVCCAFLHVRLVDGLVHVGTHGNEMLARKARLLLVDVLRVIARIFPDSTCSELLVVPSLIEFTTGDVARSRSDRADKAAAVLADMAEAFALSATKGGGVGQSHLTPTVELGSSVAAEVVNSLHPHKRPGLSAKVLVNWAGSISTVHDVNNAILAMETPDSEVARRGSDDSSSPSSSFSSSSSSASNADPDKSELGRELRQQLLELLLPQPDRAQLAIQLDASKVLTREGKDPTLWQWDIIHDCITYSLFGDAHSLADALKTKFVKRLMSFLRLPRAEDRASSRGASASTATSPALGATLATVEWQPGALHIVQVAQLLLKLMVAEPAGYEHLKAMWREKRCLIWTDLGTAVAQLASQTSGPRAGTSGERSSNSNLSGVAAMGMGMGMGMGTIKGMSSSGGDGGGMAGGGARASSLAHYIEPRALLRTVTREYFMLLGLTLKQRGGMELLQQLGVCPGLLRNLVTLGTSWRNDAFSRIALTSLALGDGGIYSSILLQTFTNPTSAVPVCAMPRMPPQPFPAVGESEYAPDVGTSDTSGGGGGGSSSSSSGGSGPTGGSAGAGTGGKGTPSLTMQSYASTLQRALVRSRPTDFLLGAFKSLVGQLSAMSSDPSCHFDVQLWGAINDACQSKLILGHAIEHLLPLFVSPDGRMPQWTAHPALSDWLVRTAGLRVGLDMLASSGMLQRLLVHWALPLSPQDPSLLQHMHTTQDTGGCEEYVTTCDALVSSSLRAVSGGIYARGRGQESNYVALLSRKALGRGAALRRTREREGAYRSGLRDDHRKGGRDRDREHAQPIPVFVEDRSPRMRAGGSRSAAAGVRVAHTVGAGAASATATSPPSAATSASTPSTAPTPTPSVDGTLGHHPPLTTGRDLLGLLSMPWTVEVTEEYFSGGSNANSSGASGSGRATTDPAAAGTQRSARRFSYNGAPLAEGRVCGNGGSPGAGGRALNDLACISLETSFDVEQDQDHSLSNRGENVAVVRARVVDEAGLPRRPGFAGHPVRSDKTLSAALLLGICPLHRSGYIHPDPSKVAKMRGDYAAAVDVAMQAAGSSKVGKGTKRQNKLPDGAQVLARSAVAGVESEQDWIHCKPTHRQHCSSELGDGLFAVEVPGTPVMWIFARDAPTHEEASSTDPHKGREEEVNARPHPRGIGPHLMRTTSRATGLRPGTVVYLVEVRYLVRIEGGQPTFVHTPRHFYGELARSVNGRAILHEQGIVRSLLHSARGASSSTPSGMMPSTPVIPPPISLERVESFGFGHTSNAAASSTLPKSLLSRRAAVLALGHIGAEDGGYKLITDTDAGFLRWCTNAATSSPYFGVRATCFQALGLIGRCDSGARAIQQLQWDCPSSPEAGAMAVPRNLAPLFNPRLTAMHDSAATKALGTKELPLVTVDFKGAVTVNVDDFDTDSFTVLDDGPDGPSQPNTYYDVLSMGVSSAGPDAPDVPADGHPLSVGLPIDDVQVDSALTSSLPQVVVQASTQKLSPQDREHGKLDEASLHHVQGEDRSRPVDSSSISAAPVAAPMPVLVPAKQQELPSISVGGRSVGMSMSMRGSVTDSYLGAAAVEDDYDYDEESSPVDMAEDVTPELLALKRKLVVECVATLPGYLHTRRSMKELEALSRSLPRVFACRELYVTIQRMLATHAFTLETRRDVLALFPTIAHTKRAETLLTGHASGDSFHDLETSVSASNIYLYDYDPNVGSLPSPSTSQFE